MRVLCWIMTSPDNLEKKAIHVYRTWAHKCNKLIFVSSKENNTFPAPVISKLTHFRLVLQAPLLSKCHARRKYYTDNVCMLKLDWVWFKTVYITRYQGVLMSHGSSRAQT